MVVHAHFVCAKNKVGNDLALFGHVAKHRAVISVMQITAEEEAVTNVIDHVTGGNVDRAVVLVHGISAEPCIFGAWDYVGVLGFVAAVGHAAAAVALVDANGHLGGCDDWVGFAW